MSDFKTWLSMKSYTQPGCFLKITHYSEPAHELSQALL